MDEEMKLPKGKKCEDCHFVKKCVAMFGVKPENTYCDFYPIRFTPILIEKNPINNN